MGERHPSGSSLQTRLHRPVAAGQLGRDGSDDCPQIRPLLRTLQAQERVRGIRTVDFIYIIEK